MADSAAGNLALVIGGETWVSYPRGMSFPAWFQRNYPFRGQGIVSRLLYLMNKSCLDRLFLKKVEPPDVSDELKSSVAFFWPSSKRSTMRFYGYRVKSGAVTEYLKLATTEEEKHVLAREAENVKIAQSISKGAFFVPGVVGIEKFGEVLAVRYQALPFNATTCPVDDKWIGKVKSALKVISDAGYMHGDFAWHNFKAVGDDLWILDWEEMRKSENPLSDEICLECGLAHYWRHEPIVQVMDKFRMKYGGDAVTRAKAREAVDDLAKREITMGAVLKTMLDKEGWQ